MDKLAGKSVTRWRRAALGFIVAYLFLYTLFPLICQPFTFWANVEPFYKFVSRAEIKEAMTAMFSVALFLLSIYYSGLFADFHAKVTGFGIMDVRINRRGQDPALTPMWITRISDSPEITIIGTKARGWFIKAKEELDHFLETNSKRIETFAVYLLDPLGQTWRSMLRSEDDFRTFAREVSFVLDSLREFSRKYPFVRVFFYDSEPLHCVVARREIYLAVALPFTDAASFPELTISQGSYLGNKIYQEAVKRLQAEATPISARALDEYRTILHSYMTKTRDEFSADALTRCDFCREIHGLPNSFTARHREIPDGRILKHTGNFVVFPSLGQLFDNYLLIVSNSHVTASAQLSDEQLKELNELFAQFDTWCRGQQRNSLIFEHGIPFESRTFGGCGLCHCHVHAVPLSVPDTQKFVNAFESFLRTHDSKLTVRELKSWNEIKGLRDAAYLAVRIDSHYKAYLFDAQKQIPSQLARRFLCEHFNLAKPWDWRQSSDDSKAFVSVINSSRSIFT